ncbi:MAG: nucleotide exchange factor GrpE, partial [Chthoniobacterales bacterium]
MKHHDKEKAEAPAQEAEQTAEQDHAAEAEKFRDLAMRTAADFDNFRKRAAREKEDAIRFANNNLLEQWLPVLDNFELGMDAARSAPDASGILQGLDMVGRQFRD